MSTELSIRESYEMAKSVCSGVKFVVSNFKKNGIVRKHEMEILQNNLDALKAGRKMCNEAQLFELSMDKIDNFMKKYDVEHMDKMESKIFYSKLEKLNDSLDKILEEYANKIL